MLLIGILILIFWFCVLTQGSIFGHNVVLWFYNHGAMFYNTIKRHDDTVLADAVRKSLNVHGEERRAIDLATGTGRAAKVLRSAGFDGPIIGLDGSYAMLQYNQAVLRARATLPTLPVQSDCIDVVISFEALEFIGIELVYEAFRVLRPGGQLIISNRNFLTALIGCYTDRQFQSILSTIGFRRIQTIGSIRYAGVKFYSIYTMHK